MGNGSTTEFTFNFPYFENSDVVVTKNGAAATGYNIVGNSAGLDADIPYVGGKVVFDTAPTALDNIVIARSLPLARQYDYQPLEQINPTTLNQDMNYMMEVLKDLQDELDGLRTQYSEIADKESTTTLLARISAIHDEIVVIAAQITALGDISTLRSDVLTNAGDITSLKDAANFTATGKTAIAHMSMPSSRYTDLTLGTSGTTYTAPADGYFSVNKTPGAVDKYIQLINLTSGLSSTAISYNTTLWTRIFIPVSKGDSVRVDYDMTGTTNAFRFIYANGAS